MKNSLLLLAGAAALSLASCSQDKTGTATTTETSTSTTATTTGAGSEAALEARAQRIADKMAADMKITDEATKTKIRTAYLNRSRRLSELRSKYTSDTTGMAEAMRGAYSETDTEFKGVFTDPAQYSAYESSRSNYDDSNFPDEAMSADGSMSAGSTSGSMSSDGSMSSGSGSMDNSAMSSGSGSMSSGDDTKVKVKRDGDVKIKDSEGNKSKIDGDDGTVKLKSTDGSKTKME